MSLRLLDKQEKVRLVATFPTVVTAKDGHTQFTKGGWTKYFMQFDYVFAAPDKFVRISKPSIDSTLYYDDERPAPYEKESQKQGAFNRYNWRNFNDYNYFDWKRERHELETKGCCSGLYIDQPYILTPENNPEADGQFIFIDTERYNPNKIPTGHIKTEMTKSDIQDFEKILLVLKDQFQKRLDTYYKRYSDNIYSYGYWANR